MKLAIALLVVAAACSSTGRVVEGRLIEVQGDLSAIESFVVLTSDGESFEFVADAAATFHDGPLSHIRDHLISGEPIVVSYTERDGQRVATGVEDG